MNRIPFRQAIPALAFATALVVAACGGSDGGETAETTTSTTSSSTTTAAPSSAPTTTTTEVDLGPTYPLTGEPLGDDDELTTPALVIKIGNNDSNSRASLIGLDQADIVFEERIESNATRFASVFHSSIPEEVGPIRSARTSDIQIVSNLNNPIFGYSGSNQGVASQLREARNQGILTTVTAETGASPFYRSSSFRAPYNLMVSGPRMLDQAPDDAAPPDPIFDYSDNSVDLGVPSPGVTISARSPSAYVWSEDDGGYLRFQSGTPHVTREGIQVTPANVVVLTTTYRPSQIDAASVDAITVGSGPVVVYSNGYRVEGTWERAFPRDPFTFMTPDGDIIGLAPGQTWVSLAPGGAATQLTVREADELR